MRPNSWALGGDRHTISVVYFCLLVFGLFVMEVLFCDGCWVLHGGWFKFIFLVDVGYD